MEDISSRFSEASISDLLDNPEETFPRHYVGIELMLSMDSNIQSHTRHMCVTRYERVTLVYH